jgi:hypothetical protein
MLMTRKLTKTANEKYYLTSTLHLTSTQLSQLIIFISSIKNVFSFKYIVDKNLVIYIKINN